MKNLDKDIPQWEKDSIDIKLDAIAKNPESLKPINGFPEELKRKV